MDSSLIHPEDALFTAEKRFPVITACDHYAGTEKLMRKALALQQELGPIFDVTCDCEDGAPSGREAEHARMVADVLNSDANRFDMAGVRIHDPSHPHWQRDIDVLVDGAGARIAHLTIPKPTAADQVFTVVDYLQQRVAAAGLSREIPVHVLVVSSHHGAIPAAAMRSPGQFEHRLLARAKAELVAAALANGLVPAHNVSLDLKNREATFSDARRARTWRDRRSGNPPGLSGAGE